jgi:mannosyltransferase
VRVVPDVPARASSEGGTQNGAQLSPPRPDALRTTVGVAIGVAIVVGVVLRFWTRSDLWSDEALSANIANLPLHDLRAALRQDGAPPLYYALLHVWMRLFGSGDLTVRAMSGMFSLATVPLVWFAGRRLDRRRVLLGMYHEDRFPVAWAAVLLLLSSPFAIRYATEARMYSLVMLLAAGGYLAVLRAFDRPTVPRLAVISVVTGLLLYTHYWAFALITVAVSFLVFAAVRGERRRPAVRMLVAIAVGCATFIPWIPTFLYQERHTGTPWGNPLSPWKGTSTAILSFGGSTRFLAWGLLLLVLLALFARARDERHLEVDLWTRPGVRPELLAAIGALWCGLAVSYVGNSAFESRYASVVFPLFVLVAAFGVSVFISRPLRYAVVALAVVLGFAGGVSNVRTNRTQASQVASAIVAGARAGDLIVYCPDSSGPDVHRLLPDWKGYREVTFPDLAAAGRVNWVDYEARTSAVTPTAFALRVQALAGSRDIWFVWSSGLNGLKDKCERTTDALTFLRPNRTALILPDPAFFEHAGLVHYRAS